MYYGVPGIDVPPDTGFQYREPSEDKAFMKPDEYDALIDDPTAFLYNTWLPRVSADIRPMDAHTSYRNNLALVKGAMAMNNYFAAYGPHVDLLRKECGTVSAIAGIFKAPFDILADKLRGYIGLTMDMIEQPDKVLKACEALMPHLYNVALTSSDLARQVPIGYWMHRGCIPFVSKGQFESHYWPTTRPIIEELWRQGHQTLFYAEGNWGHHLHSFTELPDASIVYHVDRGDIFKTHEILGHKFCLSGGIPNFELAYGKPDQVRAIVKKVIEGVAQEGGYIVDASATMQNDVSIENLRAMTDAAREYGVYSGVATRAADPAETVAPPVSTAFPADYGLVDFLSSGFQPALVSRGPRSARKSPISRVTPTLRSASGRRSTRWQTASSGRFCCPSKEALWQHRTVRTSCCCLPTISASTRSAPWATTSSPPTSTCSYSEGQLSQTPTSWEGLAAPSAC